MEFWNDGSKEIVPYRKIDSFFKPIFPAFQYSIIPSDPGHLMQSIGTDVLKRLKI